MKYIFLLVCIMCALAGTALSVIYATGRIPFYEEKEQESESSAKKKSESIDAGHLTVFSSGSEVVEELKSALKRKQAEYQRKIEELEAKESEIKEQQQIIEALKVEIRKIAAELDNTIVDTEESEKENFKRLADVYGKMAPASAASLLRNMEKERAAKILSLIDDRRAAKIMDAAVEIGDGGIASAGEWSDAIRRLRNEKKKEQ